MGCSSRLRALALGSVLLAGCAAAGEDHLTKGDRFLGDGKVADARAEYRIALRESRRPPEELLWKLGLLDLDERDLTSARAELDALLKRDASWRQPVAHAYLLFAARWFKAGDSFNAVLAVQAARTAQPGANLGPFAYDVGDAYFEQPDYERAVEQYLAGISMAPGLDPAARYRLALALDRLGRWPQAVRHYRAFLAQGGRAADTREARYHLGEAAFRTAQASFLEHRYEDALENLEVMLESGEPETRLDDAWFLVGELRYRGGDEPGAEAAFVKVLELAPSSSSRLYGDAERRLLDIRIGGAS
ncbi:MAG: tetratricopeptide repeat protein [Gemmatimonadetes bacterium]|nr:tetratricopeptide repeat protein [Gemmatimonadota bacterium]